MRNPIEANASSGWRPSLDGVARAALLAAMAFLATFLVAATWVGTWGSGGKWTNPPLRWCFVDPGSGTPRPAATWSATQKALARAAIAEWATPLAQRSYQMQESTPPNCDVTLRWENEAFFRDYNPTPLPTFTVVPTKDPDADLSNGAGYWHGPRGQTTPIPASTDFPDNEIYLRIGAGTSCGSGGWFEDSSPSDDSEFDATPYSDYTYRPAKPTGQAAGKYDLYTVVKHEFGHVLGLTHIGDNWSDGGPVMEEGCTTYEERRHLESSDTNRLLQLYATATPTPTATARPVHYHPEPIQPYHPYGWKGLNQTQLGQNAVDFMAIEIIRGERAGLPSIYSGGGWGMNLDANVPDGTIVGGVMSGLDALCDSTQVDESDSDILATHLGPAASYEWLEATTNVIASGETYLLPMMPPYPWLFRHQAVLDNIWLWGTIQFPINYVLNTVYSSVPFSPVGTILATTKLGGNPVFPTPLSMTCLDSPQSSVSIAGTPTTNVFSTPPLAFADVNSDGQDDNSGLYSRWMAFQNGNEFGQGDSRKPFQSPPSLRSDVNYIERIIDLQCYWLDGNGCPGCDGDADGYISATESMSDPDMPANIDGDGDCLANAMYAQPGQPTDSNDWLSGMLCPVLPYSQAPNFIQYDMATDQDCDGLVDGIEVAWGSSPTTADTDGDGSPDFVEMFMFTDPTNPDTDGDGLKDKPEDDYIAAAAGAAEAGEAVNEDDNCPSVANATQANNDGARRVNGAQIPGTWASNPMGDKLGDACDQDDDNDWAIDVAEIAEGTGPLVRDSDGDRCLDGVEGYLGSDPLSAASKCPANLNKDQLKFFKACRWNLPANGYDGGYWDEEYDGVDDQIEWDPDGDGVDCQNAAGTVFDPDNDNGNGTGAAASDEITDNIEIKGYGTMPANKDSDGDGCQDWVEIVDVNGNRQAEVTDVMFIAKRAFGLIPASDSDPLMDIDKNGSVQTSDALMAAKNSVLVKPHTACLLE